jgi:hypothetical protein
MSNGTVNGATSARSVQPSQSANAPTAAPPASAATLPTPSMNVAAASGDAMAMLYALTSSQRDADGKERTLDADLKGKERQAAIKQQQDELQQAKDAQEHSGFFGKIAKALGSVADKVVGGTPLGDIAHDLSDATGCKVFDIAYDIIRPDALLNAAVMLAGAATGSHVAKDVVDMKGGDGPQGTSTSMLGSGPSMKDRFQGAADVSGKQDVMQAYEVTRDATAGAMMTVATCGAGTVAVVAIASSAALMAEQKADLLGKLGVSDRTAMYLRLGAQCALIVVNVGAAVTAPANSVTAGIKTGAKMAVHVANGANQVGRGAAQVGQVVYQRESDDHMAEATRAENTQKQADRDTQVIIDGLREVSKSYQQTLQTLANAMNERDQTPIALAHHIA